MAEDLGLSTPRLQYLSYQRDFLSKFLDKQVWDGDFGSKVELSAVSGLLEYLKKTRSLREDFPRLEK